jgi:hypothetical protein
METSLRMAATVFNWTVPLKASGWVPPIHATLTCECGGGGAVDQAQDLGGCSAAYTGSYVGSVTCVYG